MYTETPEYKFYTHEALYLEDKVNELRKFLNLTPDKGYIELGFKEFHVHLFEKANPKSLFKNNSNSVVKKFENFEVFYYDKNSPSSCLIWF